MTYRPTKMTNRELFKVIQNCILEGRYVFKRHAIMRLGQRKINDLEILMILEKRTYRRNNKKDCYVEGREHWNYCIEGKSIDQKWIRIIISFEANFMPIITVMWI